MVEVSIGRRVEIDARVDGGVVDQEVYRAARRADLGDEGARLLHIGEIALDEMAVATHRLLGLAAQFLATATAASAPIFFLAGGPGQSNLDFRPPLALLRTHDVILVGFRGVDCGELGFRDVGDRE